MKVARILVLGVALAAGGAAAFVVAPGEDSKTQAPRAVQIETADVLIATSNISTLVLRFGAGKTAEGISDHNPLTALFALVSAATNDAS